MPGPGKATGGAGKKIVLKVNPPVQETSTASHEGRVARFILYVGGNSYLALGLGFLATMAIHDSLTGEIDLATETIYLKALILAFFYVLSMWLIHLLPRQTPKRRLAIWLFVLSFHAGLLSYLGIAEEFGTAILLLGLGEFFISVMSLVGLVCWLLDSRTSS